MKITECMLCWIPGTDNVKIVPYPDEPAFSKQYYTVGACNMALHGWPKHKQIVAMLTEGYSLIKLYKCDPGAVIRALEGIDELRTVLQRDPFMEAIYK